MSLRPPLLIVVAAVIVRDGRVLLSRRNPGSHLAGMWELPGGKVEPHEAPPEALRREILEELGVDAAVGAPFAFNDHEYEDRRVLLLAYRAELAGAPEPIGCAELGWFTPAEIAVLPTPPADAPIFARIAASMG